MSKKPRFGTPFDSQPGKRRDRNTAEIDIKALVPCFLINMKDIELENGSLTNIWYLRTIC